MHKLILVKESAIHHKGVFAKEDIPKGIKVIEYVGDKLTKEESDKRADEQLLRAEKNPEYEGLVYIFELDDKYDIDGNVPENDAKYINHSCDPNCEIDIIDGHIWIISKKDIKKGEELFYNYGYDPEDFQDHPCLCGAENCVGYIVGKDHWPEVKKALEDKKIK
jgi:SET domain-containing protein